MNNLPSGSSEMRGRFDALLIPSIVLVGGKPPEP